MRDKMKRGWKELHRPDTPQFVPSTKYY